MPSITRPERRSRQDVAVGVAIAVDSLEDGFHKRGTGIGVSSFLASCIILLTVFASYRYGSRFTSILERGLSQGMVNTKSIHNESISQPAASETTTNTGIGTGQPHPSRVSDKPTCIEVMNWKNSVYKDGDFLMRHTQPVFWRPRADGSRRLEHSMCELHRYTAEEAKKCLKGKHINYIGDSLTRYQFMSMAYFLEKGHYPPRFERPVPPTAPCWHLDEEGQPTCSPPDEPNICSYRDWVQDPPPGITGFMHFDMSLGSTMFNGRMEANAIRTDAMNKRPETYTENYMYVTPLSEEVPQQHVVVTFNSEVGWKDITPIHGWNWSNCAYHQNCTYPQSQGLEYEKRALALDYDFSEPLHQAINITNGGDGILGKILPPVDIVVYNRGIWGALNESRAAQLMPLLKQYVSSVPGGGKCFFQSTTSGVNGPGYFKLIQEKELNYVRRETINAQCGFMDLGHLVDDFIQIPWTPERDAVYVDNVHFRPWVYEEINNIWLNQVCNVQQST